VANLRKNAVIWREFGLVLETIPRRHRGDADGTTATEAITLYDPYLSPGGTISGSIAWGDGQSSPLGGTNGTVDPLSHQYFYNSTGQAVATITLTDSDGLSSTTTLPIVLTDAAPVVICLVKTHSLVAVQ
jgi:hypothetical protein